MKEKITLVCYSNHVYHNAKQKLINTARMCGEVDRVHAFAPWDIDKQFYQQNKNILQEYKGAGYWLWKPYFIQKVLRTMADNEYLLYMDAGIRIIDSIRPLINLFANNKPIICFELPYIEKYWTKRDCFIALNCDSPLYTDTKQRIGGFHLWKKCAASLDFVDEWLRFALQHELIDDSPSKASNYPGFIEHRHDQSIFSLLSKKYNIETFKDISPFRNSHKQKYNNSPYNQIMELTKEANTRSELSLFTQIKYGAYYSIHGFFPRYSHPVRKKQE